MSDPIASLAEPTSGRTAAPDHVREYVGDLAGQLALMARDAGDEALAQALQTAVDLSTRSPARPVVIEARLKRQA